MRDINSLTKNYQSPSNKLNQEGKANKFEPTSRQVAMITRFWEKMGQIFAAKWFSQNGQMMEADIFTENFLHWCEETANLTDSQWLEGFAAVERRIVADIAHNRESWPPTAPIFKAMCKPTSTTSGQSAQSFKRHPNLEAKDSEQKQIAVDPSYKERKKEAGKTALKNMMESL